MGAVFAVIHTERERERERDVDTDTGMKRSTILASQELGKCVQERRKKAKRRKERERPP